MKSMTCLIMQCRPYIVEQSCMGVSLRKSQFCRCGKTAETHEPYKFVHCSSSSSSSSVSKWL